MERYLYELARFLAAGAEVHVFAVDHDPLPGVAFHSIRAPARPILARNLAFRARARRAVDAAGAFDLVHSVGGAVANPDVVTLQYCQPAWGEALRTLRSPAMTLRRRAVQEISWRVNAVFERAAARGASGRGGLIACSRRTAEEAARFYGTRGATAIHNAVDSAAFTPAGPGEREVLRRARGMGNDGFDVLFMGEYVRKRLDIALEALARSQHPKMRLRVVGRGPLEPFARLARELGVGDRTTFAGFARETRDEFRACDAFIFPSWYEPFGMVVAEAMACARPVVASSVCGAVEVMAPGATGMVVDPPGDVDAYANSLDLLATDRGRAQAIGGAAREAVTRLDWAGVHAATTEVYRRVLAAGP
jgi:glycosyltransferase involved in cell wall biosynthesis